MKIKEIWKRALFYLSVPKCVFCHEKLSYEDKGLCKDCFQVYESHKMRNCSRCSNILSECVCTNKYMADHNIKRHIKIFRYLDNETSAPGNFLIYSLKRDYREDVIDFLSDELASTIEYNIPDVSSGKYVITNVPRRKKGILLYGYDHTATLAGRIGKKLNIEYVSALRSNLKKPQKEMRGEDRVRNADYDYKKRFKRDIRKKNVIIVDDVVTTGASVGSCAMLFKGLGTKEIVAASISSAYNDMYEKRERSEF